MGNDLMPDNKIKVWITKYALTTGVYEVEVDHCVGDNMVRVSGSWNSNEYFHNEGKEWHLTQDDAKKKAEDMRLKKIESLKKQLTKLEKLDFTK